MARAPVVKRYPTGRAGGYVAPVDTAGMDSAMVVDLTGTPLTKVERDYLSGTNRASARKAIQKARKANKLPPARFDD